MVTVAPGESPEPANITLCPLWRTVALAVSGAVICAGVGPTAIGEGLPFFSLCGAVVGGEDLGVCDRGTTVVAVDFGVVLSAPPPAPCRTALMIMVSPSTAPPGATPPNNTS